MNSDNLIGNDETEMWSHNDIVLSRFMSWEVHFIQRKVIRNEISIPQR